MRLTKEYQKILGAANWHSTHNNSERGWTEQQIIKFLERVIPEAVIYTLERERILKMSHFKWEVEQIIDPFLKSVIQTEKE